MVKAISIKRTLTFILVLLFYGIIGIIPISFGVVVFKRKKNES